MSPEPDGQTELRVRYKGGALDGQYGTWLVPLDRSVFVSRDYEDSRERLNEATGGSIWNQALLEPEEFITLITRKETYKYTGVALTSMTPVYLYEIKE